MSITTDALYSLEVVATTLRTYTQAGKFLGKNLNPALAVRLLDFPMLLIFPSKKLHAETKTPTHTALRQILEFQTGKSCLFRAEPEVLEPMLSEVRKIENST